MTPDLNRILYVMKWLSENLNDTQLKFYNISKILYCTDRWYTEQYGRPVTFCNYVLKHGFCTPSELYKIIRQPSEIKDFTSVINTSNYDRLSVSDIEALTFAVNDPDHYEMIPDIENWGMTEERLEDFLSIEKYYT